MPPGSSPRKPSKPVTFTCSCGATEVIHSMMRGLEQSCEECGRIFRVPSVGDVLDLRIIEQEGKSDEVMDALKMLAGEREDFDEKATSRTMVRLVWLILVLGTLAYAIYLLAR